MERNEFNVRRRLFPRVEIRFLIFRSRTITDRTFSNRLRAHILRNFLVIMQTITRLILVEYYLRKLLIREKRSTDGYPIRLNARKCSALKTWSIDYERFYISLRMITDLSRYVRNDTISSSVKITSIKTEITKATKTLRNKTETSIFTHLNEICQTIGPREYIRPRPSTIINQI